MSLLNKVLQGDVLAAAKLMRGLEDEVAEAVAELEGIYLHTGKAYIVGTSGAPGAGKSTLLGRLIGAFRKRNMKVGVVAIDPTSPLTGGAILGDRLRMQNHGTDKDVFIRSLASRAAPEIFYSQVLVLAVDRVEMLLDRAVAGFTSSFGLLHAEDDAMPALKIGLFNLPVAREALPVALERPCRAGDADYEKCRY